MMKKGLIALSLLMSGFVFAQDDASVCEQPRRGACEKQASLEEQQQRLNASFNTYVAGMTEEEQEQVRALLKEIENLRLECHTKACDVYRANQEVVDKLAQDGFFFTFVDKMTNLAEKTAE